MQAGMHLFTLALLSDLTEHTRFPFVFVIFQRLKKKIQLIFGLFIYS